ncbi:uncharacterized protein LOC142322226 isoform X3 [Lycorma delicatula]|uniref:uncharacterized protein LOC142322226 isoform X3 n=1 Tax=Lycorma delicatula TaxID=130591 RepID=UPI003F516170
MSKILNILLQRNDSQYPWGFNIAGTPGALYIDKVSPGALSSQHLSVGDRVVQVAGIDSERLNAWQAQEIVQRPDKCLELVVVKGGQSSRKFSDCSESIASSSESVPWQWRCRPGSSSSVDARKAKRQFWERCSSGLRSRDFYNSVDSELFRSRGRHSRSHSLERGSSFTPVSFSSNTDLFHSSVLSEPIWTHKTGRRNFLFDWDRTQSFTDDTDKLFPDKKADVKQNRENSGNRFYGRESSCPGGLSTENFKESATNKPGKFPWHENPDDYNPNYGCPSKKLDKEQKEFAESNHSEVTSSFSERTCKRTHNKKEMKTYEMEETSSKISDTDRNYVKEEEKSYVYRKSGSVIEETSPFGEEMNRCHTPAGFYENHREEFVKEERSFIDKRGKSVEREVSRRSYSHESTVERNAENTQSEAKDDFHSSKSSKLSNTYSDVHNSNDTYLNETNFSQDDSKTPTNVSVEDHTLSDYSTATSKSEFSNNSYQYRTKQNKSFESHLQNPKEKNQSAEEYDNKYLQSECFSKYTSNKDKRNIFDARKYWSCSSPISDSKFVFVPANKPLDTSIIHNTRLQQINENQPLSHEITEEPRSDVQEIREHRSTSVGRQQNQISGGNNLSPTPTSPASGPVFDSTPTGGPPAPPPPPPPPSGTGVPPPPPPIGLVHIPAIRLKSEIPDVRREPPAAIQNAMMKDKKPFTYTPGGLDLSEIRSPRMQRRISRNAQTTDSTQAPPAQQPHQQSRPVSLPPSAAAAMQPQIAIPVFPQGNPNINQSVPPSTQSVNNFQAPPPPPPPVQQPMAVPKVQPQRQLQHNQNTGSIYVPPVQQQQSQPRSQLGSLYIPPVHNQQQDSSPTVTPTPPTPVNQLNKAPTPWLSRQPQSQKEVPPWVNREDSTPSPVTSPHIQNSQKQPSPQQQQNQPQARIIPIQIEGREPAQPNTRIIPIQIEGSPSPKHNMNQPSFQQQQQQGYQKQSVQQQQQKFQQQQYQQPPQQQYQQPPQQQQNQQRWPVYVHNKFNPPSPSIANENTNIANGRSQPNLQQNWGNSVDGSSSPAPVQSRSFRVLQKITDTDSGEGAVDQVDMPYNSQGVPVSQLRKLQLSDDDRALMNKVKTQVSDTILPVDEENPRYRGGYIPSRVFKALDESVPQDPNDNQMRTLSRRPQQPESVSPAQPYIPPSEQQVQEPRMYTGAAIPSRSFRMLQAMTGPDPSGSQVCQSGSEISNNVEGDWASSSPYHFDPNYYYYYPPQTPEEQQQFWNHYNAMCAYMAEMNAAAYRYSPHPHSYSPHHFAPPMPPPPPTHYFSDNDEYSGYSSTEEMSRYYRPYFQNYAPQYPPHFHNYQYQMQPTTPTPEIVITPTNQVDDKKYMDESSDAERESDKNESTPIPLSETGESDESTSGSDTEVEDDAHCNSGGLQTIKSVPNINVYKDSSTSDIQSHISEVHGDGEDEDEGDEDDEFQGDDDDHCDDDSSVHQLSVIYEESEHSDAESLRKRSFNSHDSLILTATSEDDSSTTTLDNGDDTDGEDDDNVIDSESATVMVRLPLKLKFSKSENNEEVTTVIVGNSEVESTSDVASETPNKSEGMIIEEVTKDELEPDVSVTISLRKLKNKPESTSNSSEMNKTNDLNKENEGREKSPVDFWKTLNSEEQKEEQNEIISNCTQSYNKDIISFVTEDEEVKLDESDGHWEDDSSSTSVQTVRTGTAVHTGSGSEVDVDMPGVVDEEHGSQRTSPSDIPTENVLATDTYKDDESESEESSDEDSSCSTSSSSDDSDSENADEEALHKSDQTKQKHFSSENEEILISTVAGCEDPGRKDTCVKTIKQCDRLKAKADSKKDPSKFHDDSEEDDSGVTSDMSRHISETDTDPECGSELRKLSRYQRAATHSRLFKLLQEECAQEENEPLDELTSQNTEIVDTENVSFRKERLTLPLRNNSTSEPDSLSSSSGVNSPSSPTVNDRLVKELVQSLLKRKKGRNFRKLPIAKLHAAALRILQEDMDQYDTTSSTSEDNVTSSRTRTESRADMMTSQANNNTAITNQNAFFDNNYYDYCQYYSSWDYPMYYGVDESLGHDILPSRAFRLLQEYATSENVSPGFIEGLKAKCPKVFSSGNIPNDISSTSPSPSQVTSESVTPSTET